jgi:hypothetical protein
MRCDILTEFSGVLSKFGCDSSKKGTQRNAIPGTMPNIMFMRYLANSGWETVMDHPMTWIAYNRYYPYFL